MPAAAPFPAARGLPMREHSMRQQGAGAKTSAWVTVVLSAAGAVAVLVGAYSALGSKDNEALESPLMLSVARQLLRGPWELYGPFDGLNPLVIIHAPLYYHLAALLAWPLYRAGFEAVSAAQVAGRSLSFLGLVWTLAIAYRLARSGGMPRRVGWWAVLLIASSAVVGVMPYSVRPDMLGVALQTTGVFLILSVLQSERPSGTITAAAFAAFGLAFCVKQQYVVAPALSTVLLVTAVARGRISSRLVGRGLLTGLAVVLVVYGIEELATAGRMSQAVFRAASNVRVVHPGSGEYASIVFVATIGRSSGLIVMLMAVGLTAAGARDRVGPRALVLAGALIMGLIAAHSLGQLLPTDVAQLNPFVGFIILVAGLVFVIPASFLLAHQTLLASRLDQVLWVYVAAELGCVATLALLSTGVWVNYAIQATVFGAVLVARGLERALEHASLPRQVVPPILAVLVVFASGNGEAMVTARHRDVEQLALDEIIHEQVKRPSTEFFVVARPGSNRLNGRLDLVYDHWLYPVFESIHQAQPRSVWLQQALMSGSIRFVVNTSDSPKIDGLGTTLPQLGYLADFKLGPFYVWKRFPQVVAPSPR